MYQGSEDFIPFQDDGEDPEAYLEALIGPLRKTRDYKKTENPKEDVFLGIFGLNTREVAVAKERHGRMTSIFRQIGMGCEDLLNLLIQKKLGVPPENCEWSRKIGGKSRSLDACIRFADVRERKPVLEKWVRAACLARGVPFTESGVVFEVRQGHKSGDSKRQEGDEKNAIVAREEGFLPVLMVFSVQLPDAAKRRYESNKWIVLTGKGGGSSFESTYAFFREVIGFDVLGLMEDHQDEIRALTNSLLPS